MQSKAITQIIPLKQCKILQINNWVEAYFCPTCKKPIDAANNVVSVWVKKALFSIRFTRLVAVISESEFDTAGPKLLAI